MTPAATVTLGLSTSGIQFRASKVLLAGDNMGSLSSRSEAGNIGDTVLSRFKVTFDCRRKLMFLEQLKTLTLHEGT